MSKIAAILTTAGTAALFVLFAYWPTWNWRATSRPRPESVDDLDQDERGWLDWWLRR